MGRAGVLPRALDSVNRRGAPVMATAVTSVISFVVIVIFVAKGWDPVLNLFYWFSGLAVIAIAFVEILVSVAVIAFFSRHRGEASVWASVFAPMLSVAGLAVGLYLLMSRFALLAGTVKDGVDPVAHNWALNTTGWILVLAPFVMFVVGTIVGKIRLSEENEDAVADLVT
jgi:amino acid transporter